MRYVTIVTLLYLYSCNNNSNTTIGEQALKDTSVTIAPVHSSNQDAGEDLEAVEDALKTLKP